MADGVNQHRVNINYRVIGIQYSIPMEIHLFRNFLYYTHIYTHLHTWLGIPMLNILWKPIIICCF